MPEALYILWRIRDEQMAAAINNAIYLQSLVIEQRETACRNELAKAQAAFLIAQHERRMTS